MIGVSLNNMYEMSQWKVPRMNLNDQYEMSPNDLWNKSMIGINSESQWHLWLDGSIKCLSLNDMNEMIVNDEYEMSLNDEYEMSLNDEYEMSLNNRYEEWASNIILKFLVEWRFIDWYE